MKTWITRTRIAPEMKTRHNSDCSRAFKNYDANCARCQELAAGQAPRAGWSDWKKAQDARDIAAIKAHNCQESHCSVVCTFGDW